MCLSNSVNKKGQTVVEKRDKNERSFEFIVPFLVHPVWDNLNCNIN